MKEVKLSDVCEVIAGQSPPSSTYNNKGVGIPFFQGKTDFGYINPTVRYWCHAPQKIALPNDILISVRAPVGPTNINIEKSCIGRGLSAIRCSDKIETKFLLHYLRSNENKIAEKANGSTFSAITQKDLQQIQIPLPPLETQKKIAAILDAADAYRQKTKILIEKYDQLAQSLFLDMFGDPVRNEKGWEKRILGSLTNMITDGKHGNCNDEVNSGYYFISAKDVNNGSIDYRHARQIPKNEFKETDLRTNLQPGDLVMVNTGATIGKMSIAKNIPETRRTTFQKSVAVIKTKKELISNVFLQYVFQLRISTFANKGSGSAIQNLLLSEMRKFEIITPELPLQNQFSERIQLIEAQKQQAQASLQKAEDLFNSLLQRAFKGELVN